MRTLKQDAYNVVKIVLRRIMSTKLTLTSINFHWTMISKTIKYVHL